MYRGFLIRKNTLSGEGFSIDWVVPSTWKKQFLGCAPTREEAKESIDTFWGDLNKYTYLEDWLDPEELRELRLQRARSLFGEVP